MTEEELLQVIGHAERERATELDLSGNCLTALPPEIGKLTQLKKLILGKYQYDHKGQITDVIGNNLSDLPVEIGKLSHLEELQIVDNQLSVLPAGVGQLTNLQSLYLNRNQLSELPAGIGQLNNLQSLDLSSNQLSELPAEIGQLTNLQSLHLSRNQLSELPAEIRQMPSLKKLDLRGNPVPVPPEILGPKNTWEAPGDVNEILDFYFRVQDPAATEPLYEAKFLIVGEGGAGKTSLAKKIEDETYKLQPDEGSTKGIDVIQWRFTLPNGQDFRVNIWDFGGQEIYHQTHQFFLTERSLYALVADTRKENTGFDYWLNVVELLSSNSPVLIVKNEKQDRQCEVNERQLRKEFTNLEKVLPTNLATNRGLSEIKDAIEYYISRLPHVGTPLPKLWVRVRSALENYSRNYISLEEYCTLWRHNGLTDRKDMLRLSSYLHDLGVCLHFQTDPLLKNSVILKPSWGTTAVYKKIHKSYERLQYRTLVPCNCESCKEVQTPFSYPLDVLYRCSNAPPYQIQCQNSFQMVDARRLIDDVMRQPFGVEQEPDSRTAHLQRELSQQKDESLRRQHPQLSVPEPSTRGLATIDYYDFQILVTADRKIRAASEQGDEWGELRLEMNKVNLTLRLIESGQTNAELLKDLGSNLFQALFPTKIHGQLRATMAGAESAGCGLRLRLVFESPELAALPWEFLYDEGTSSFLGNNTQTALSRYIDIPLKKRDLKAASLPLKILLVISSPKDLAKLDVDEEERLIRGALAKHIEAGQIELDVLREAIIRDINQKLREKPYNIFHFIGHGVFENDQGFIALIEQNGKAKLLNDEGFADFFLGNRSLGLAVLNACQGAAVSSHRVFAGITPNLVRRGIPAVVAMQYSILDNTAKIFADEFYRTLALGWPVDASIQTTRNAISMEAGLDKRDFGTPVLYMRAKDGMILSGL